MRDMTATEVRMRTEAWNNNIQKALDTIESLTNRSYLMVRRGSGWSFPVGERVISTWRRYARERRIPRGRPTSSSVDLTLTVSPRQDEEEYRLVLPAAASSHNPHLTPELIRVAIAGLERMGESTEMILGLPEAEALRIIAED